MTPILQINSESKAKDNVNNNNSINYLPKDCHSGKNKTSSSSSITISNGNNNAKINNDTTTATAKTKCTQLKQKLTHYENALNSLRKSHLINDESHKEHFQQVEKEYLSLKLQFAEACAEHDTAQFMLTEEQRQTKKSNVNNHRRFGGWRQRVRQCRNDGRIKEAIKMSHLTIMEHDDDATFTTATDVTLSLSSPSSSTVKTTTSEDDDDDDDVDEDIRMKALNLLKETDRVHQKSVRRQKKTEKNVKASWEQSLGSPKNKRLSFSLKRQSSSSSSKSSRALAAV